MKYLQLIDFFSAANFKAARKTSQLLLICLIAHYHEKQRSQGESLDIIKGGKAQYEIIIGRNELCKKFSFSKNLLRQAQRDLKSKGLTISALRLLSVDRYYIRKFGSSRFMPKRSESFCFDGKHCFYSYDRGYFYDDHTAEQIEADEGIRQLDRRLLPFVDIEDRYYFTIPADMLKLVNIPIKVVYSRTLSHAEKLAIIWNLILINRMKRNLTYKELEKESGISERTYRKAKKQYPSLFRKTGLSA